MILGKDNIERLPLPVGTSDWATFSRNSYCVDKTLMLKELIDTETRVALFHDKQIDGRQYDATFRAEGIADVEKIGLAYFKNAVEICR